MSVKYTRVTLLADLPVSSANDGDIYFVKENSGLYVWDAVGGNMLIIAVGGIALPIAESDVTNLPADLATLTGAIAAETSRAESVEGGIEADLATEVTNRTNADTTLQTHIDSEASTRAAADTTNATAISTETTNRTNADTTEVTNRNAAIAVETARATAAEVLLLPIANPSATGVVTIEQDNLGKNSTNGSESTESILIKNLTASTNTIPQNPGSIKLKGNYWDGAASVLKTVAEMVGVWGTGSPTSASLNFNLYPPSGLLAFVKYVNNGIATALQNFSAPAFAFIGWVWNGTASIQETWEFLFNLGTGSNPTSSMTVAHFGSSGQATVDLRGSQLGSTAMKVLVPTSAVDTNTTDAASTAFVLAQAASATPLGDGVAAVGTSTRFARADHVHPTDTTLAPKASPALTGTPTAPTQAALDGSTKIATDDYADRNFKGVGIVGFREDFLQTSASSNVTTVVERPFDSGGWSVQQVVGGTQNLTSEDGTFLNPGHLILTTSAVSGQGIAIFKGGSSARGSLGALGSNAGWEFNAVVKLNQTANCCIRIGLVKGTPQNLADAPTDGIYVEYDTANTGNTNTDFTWVTRSGSTPNYSISNAIAADTSFHHFRIRSTQSGHILFSVDGGTGTDISTSVPSANLNVFVQLISRTTGAVIAVLDFISYMAATGRV